MSASPSTLFLVRQSRQALFRSLIADRPTIVQVQAGQKIVRYGERITSIGTAALGVLPARLPLTIENRPPFQGKYMASALLPDPELIESMKRDGLPNGDPFSVTLDDRALSAFERASVAIDDPLMPDALRNHAVREVVLWLAEAGVGFGATRPRSFGDRLRAMIGAEPDANWKAIDAAHALAVSEATLRRRLAAEGTAFGDLLADVRMTCALGLLQTTDWPVNAVALSVGYASPSRFAARFRDRFGIVPSAIRDDDERIRRSVRPTAD